MKHKSGAGHKDTAPLFGSISNVTIFVGIAAASFESRLIQRRRSDIAPGCSLLSLYALIGSNESAWSVKTATDLYRSSSTCVILAGGSSRRFGTDKAMAIVPGTELTMLESIVQTAFTVCGQVLIVGDRRTKWDDHRVLWIADRYPGQGPLGGLVTAGESSLVGRAVVIGVDQPYITSAVLGRLDKRSRQLSVPVCFAESGIVHPLPVAIDLPCVAAQLKSTFLIGERSLRAALLEIGLQSIPIQADELPFLRDVDRPSDFVHPGNIITEG